MKGRKKIGSLKQALSLLFAVVMVLGLFNGLSTKAEAPESKFVYETVGLQLKTLDPTTKETAYEDVVVRGGELVEGAPAIHEGAQARIIYKFEVKPGANPSDSFTIQLPNNNVLKGELRYNYIEDKGKSIGTYQVDGSGLITLKFDKPSGGIRNGLLVIHALFVAAPSNFSYPFGKMNAPKEVPLSITAKPSSSPAVEAFSPGNFPKNGNFAPFKKENWGITYNISFNEVEFSKVFEVNVAKRGSFKKIKNALFYDELPEGMVYPDVPSIKIWMRYPAYEGGKILNDSMSWYKEIWPFSETRAKAVNQGNQVIYYTNSDGKANRKVFLTLDKSGDSMTWEEFQKYILKQPAPILGMWKKKKLVGKLGSFPRTDVTYDDFYEGPEGFRETLSNMVKSNHISEDQKTMMEEAFIGQGIISYTLDYSNSLEGISKPKYTNIASVKYDGEETIVKSATYTQDVGFAKGEQLEDTNNTFKVEKIWRGTAQSSIEVELFDDTEGTSFTPESATLTSPSSLTHEFTGLSKMIDSHVAKYRVREKNLPDNYTSVVEYHYDSSTKEKKFVITNIEKKDFKVIHKWVDETSSPLTEIPVTPSKITLYAGDRAVPVLEGGTPYSKEISSYTGGAGEVTFPSLDWYKEDGTEMNYKAKLENVPKGFESTGAWDSSENAFVITTKRKSLASTKDIEISVVWQDEKGSLITDAMKLGSLPSLPIGLHNVTDENTILSSHSFTAPDFETKTLTVPVFDSSKTVIDYRLKVTAEDSSPLKQGYELSVSGDMETGFEVVARLKTVDLKVVKVWKDKEQKEIEATDQLPKVTVKLHKDNEIAPIKTAIIGFFDGWFKVFKKLPLFEGSRKILYSLKEDKVAKVDGYEEFVSDISFDEANHQFTVVNHEPYPSSGGGWIGGGGSDSDLNKDKDKDKEKEKEKDKDKEKDKEKEKDKKDKGEEDKDKTEPIVDIINPSVIPSLPTIQEIKEEDEKKLIIPVIDIEDSETALSATDIPETPSLLAVKEEEIPELLLDGDEVPLGDTELTYDEEGNLVTWKRGDKSRESKGYPILAKTGGLSVSFIPLLLLLSLVGALSFLMFYRRKRES